MPHRQIFRENPIFYFIFWGAYSFAVAWKSNATSIYSGYIENSINTISWNGKSHKAQGLVAFFIG
jgi:hypothetical protein